MANQILSPVAPALALCAVLAALAGCASVVPSSAIPDATRRYKTQDVLSPAATDAGLKLGVPSREWWSDIGDARLDELVHQAMTNNHDHRAVLATVREARALAGMEDRAGLPQGSLSAGTQVVRPSLAEVDPYDEGLPRPSEQRLASMDQMVSWEIDLFGRIGTAAAMAERQADAAEADARASMALLQAEVVRRYIVLRQHQSEAHQLDAELTLLRQRQQLLRARAQAGFSDTRERMAGRADLAGVQAARAAIRAATERDCAALAVLTGRAPTRTDLAWRTLLAPVELPVVPNTAKLAQPADLLANRPDVVRADASLRAALGNTVLAERAHLPRLKLSLNVGLNAAFGNLDQADALRYAAGPALQWDWLDAGRISLRAKAAQAGNERAWHQFEQTVLKALEDSENSLRDWNAAQATLQAARDAEEASRASSDYTAARAAAGIEPAGVALDSSLAHLRQRRNVTTRQAEALLAFAHVQLSLAAWKPEDTESANRRSHDQ